MQLVAARINFVSGKPEFKLFYLYRHHTIRQFLVLPSIYRDDDQLQTSVDSEMVQNVSGLCSHYTTFGCRSDLCRSVVIPLVRPDLVKWLEAALILEINSVKCVIPFFA